MVSVTFLTPSLSRFISALEPEGDIVPLQMKVARSSYNNERANQRKRERQNQEEAWVPLTYNEFESGTAGYLRSLLFGDVAEESGGNKPISNEEYLEQLAQVSKQVSRPLVSYQDNNNNNKICLFVCSLGANYTAEQHARQTTQE